MAMPEQFSLRWNDFHSNLSSSFHALLEGEDLVDVTLAAGGQYVHAHKLILSVCSPYFKELFKMNPCEHPIVILKDVAHQELRQLLQFMYRGEVHVRQQELFGFLHTAELLQVKGLTGGRETSESPQPVPEESQAKHKTEAPVDTQQEWVPGGEDTVASEAVIEPVSVHIPSSNKEEATRSPLKRLLKNSSNKNTYNNKKKPRPVNDSASHVENTEYPLDGEPLIDFDNDLYHNVLVLPESAKESGWNCKTGGVKCPSCHRFFANRYNLKVHIRDKHDTREGTLQCDICQKRMRNPSCLRVHMYHHRKQAAYLAQLGNQGDQMSVKNMVETKSGWRAEASLACLEFRDSDKIQNSVDNKSAWRNESSIDYKEGDKSQDAEANAGWRTETSNSSVDYTELDKSTTAKESKNQRRNEKSQGGNRDTEKNAASTDNKKIWRTEASVGSVEFRDAENATSAVSPAESVVSKPETNLEAV